MRHRIVILGGGTGGTLTANRLQRLYGDRAEIVVVDRDDRHVYQPGLLFVPFGLADPADIVRSRRAQLHAGIEFRLAEVESVEVVENAVYEQVDGILTVGEFYELAAGGEIIFT